MVNTGTVSGAIEDLSDTPFTEAIAVLISLLLLKQEVGESVYERRGKRRKRAALSNRADGYIRYKA